MKQRLNKLIAHSGICSRRKADDLIAQGKVKVNEKVITELGFQADPFKDIILVNNTPLSKPKKIYVLLNKPKGYITTTEDAHAEKTVLELLSKINTRIYPVGRLDKDTTGLLILTNDGALSHKLLHPKFEINRTYIVALKGLVSNETVKKIINGGIEIDNHKTHPCKIKILSRNKTKTTLTLTLHEGHKRQIRKMFHLFKHHVIELKRIQFGKLKLGTLRPGKWQHIKKSEII